MKSKNVPLINTPKNRFLNKKVSKFRLNSTNMSEIINNRILHEINQFDENKVKYKRLPPNGVVNKSFIY